MVGDLEHVGAEVGPGLVQVALARLLLVAEEQEPDAPDPDVEHDAGVVGRRVRSGNRHPDRTEHLPGELADPGLLGVLDHAERNAVRGSQRSDRPRSRRGVGQRGGVDAADVASAQHPGQPVHVVGVEVGEHQDRDGADAEPAQAGVDRGRVRTGVDHGGAVPGDAEHQGVTLTDVAGDHHPSRGRPAGRRERDQDQDAEARGKSQGDEGPGEHPAEDDGGPEAEQGQGCDPHAPRRPRERRHREPRRPLRDGDDAVGRPPGRCGDDTTERNRDEGHRPAEQSEHGGWCDERGRHQVGSHGDEAHLAGDRGDDRRARHLRRQRYCDRLGGDRREPGRQRAPPRRAEQQDARRRDDREGEPDGPGEPGVDEHQDQHPGAECPQAATRSGTSESEQADHAHRRCPQHAGLRAREQHEPGDGQDADHHQAVGAHSDPAGEEEQGTGDQGQVRAADGQQVGHAGDLEGRGERVGPAVGTFVAVDQRRYQRGRPVAETRARGADRRPHPRRRGGDHSGAGDDVRAAPGVQQPGQVWTQGRLEPTGQAEPRPERGSLPPGIVEDHEEPGVQPDPVATTGQLDRGPLEPQELAVPARTSYRLGRDDDIGRDDGPLRRESVHRRAADRLLVEVRAHSRGHDDDGDAEQCRRAATPGQHRQRPERDPPRRPRQPEGEQRGPPGSGTEQDDP